MNTPSRKLIFLPISCIVLFAAGSMIGSVISGHSASKAQQEAKRVTTLPEVVSKVRKLEIVSAMIVRAGTPDAAIAVEIRNNSNLAVMAVDLSTRDKVNSSGLFVDGFDDPDHPEIIIEPYASKTFEWEVNELIAGVPLVVSGATFADGSEDGEEEALKVMRSQRRHSRAKRTGAKGVPLQ